VPHTEVGLILANGEAAAFSHLLRDGDKISVYPVFRSLELTPLVPLQPRPEGEMRFVLDTHLGKLAAHRQCAGPMIAIADIAAHESGRPPTSPPSGLGARTGANNRGILTIRARFVSLRFFAAMQFWVMCMLLAMPLRPGCRRSASIVWTRPCTS
jgi:Mut7-C ubiquitin